jgi:signal transduction histidine kinase
VSRGGAPRTREEEVDLGDGPRQYLVSTFALREQDGTIYASCVIATDTTDLSRAQQDVLDLSARVLTAQDEERRRLAREIHDGTLQALTASILNLSRLIGANPESDRNIEESIGLIKEAHSDLRTLSYVLHPPALDELGLAPALESYVKGFRERTRIDVKLRISANIGRIEPQAEIALFRVVQESLSNIHRHSGAEDAEIRIERSPTELRLSIVDSGHGALGGPAAHGASVHTIGVGIAGMRARLQQLGGRLDIRSDPCGTSVIAVVPNAGSRSSTQSAENR